jgi:hypothetical protein
LCRLIKAINLYFYIARRFSTSFINHLCHCHRLTPSMEHLHSSSSHQ